MTPPGFAILADSAFPAIGKIIRARKVNEMGTNGTVGRNTYIAATEMFLDRAMSSERQSAELGVRAIKGPFKRVTVPLPADAYTRYRFLILVTHLCNFACGASHSTKVELFTQTQRTFLCGCGASMIKDLFICSLALQ